MSTQYQTFLYLFIFRSIPDPRFHDSLFESEALRFQIASAFYSNGKHNDYQVKILYSRWLLQCLPPVSLTSRARFPENDPRRVNGTTALIGNDPADSMSCWSSPWPEQDATLEIDASTKKEGSASLKVCGKTDSWGNLGVIYDLNGTWDLSKYSSIGVWAKSNQSAPFSIGLTDANGNSRIFWSIKAEDGSATTSWKRFSVNISDYTSQTDSFNLNIVDRIDFYVWDSNTGKPISFWIDDLTVDTSVDLEKFVYKGRVPVDETVVAYFYTRIEDE